MAVNLMIDIDDDIYTRLFDNGTEDEGFDVTEGDLCKILSSVRKGVPFTIGIDVAMANKAGWDFLSDLSLKKEKE